MGGSYLTILFRQLQILILFLSTSFCFLFCCCFVFSFWKIFLKVVAAAVFLALGFAFYVFFAPFVGEKMYQYIVIGLYSPLVTNLQIFLLSLFFFYNIDQKQTRQLALHHIYFNQKKSNRASQNSNGWKPQHST